MAFLSLHNYHFFIFAFIIQFRPKYNKKNIIFSPLLISNFAMGLRICGRFISPKSRFNTLRKIIRDHIGIDLVVAHFTKQ